MNSRLRYGVIGVGMMGCEHLHNLALIEQVDVVAVADSFAGSLAKAGAIVPAARQYADYRALLERERIDVAVIATPNHTHFDVVRDVLEQVDHLLIEKPLCTTVSDARALMVTAKAHSGVVTVGMGYRFMPATTRLVEELKAGRAGLLKMISIREHRNPFLRKVGDWNRFARNTGGTLVEKCCHFFDLMLLMANAEPVRVFASAAQSVNHLDERYAGETPDITDNAFVIVDFANGVRAMLDLCMFAEGARSQQEIIATGDTGRLEVVLPQGDLYIGTRRPIAIERLHIDTDPQLVRLGGHYGATYYEHLALVESITHGAPPRVSIADGYRAVRLGAAAEASAARGERVLMREFDQ